MFFWNSLAFLMIQGMLAIWSLVPLPFLKPVWTFHVLLKPILENFEHYFACMWDECSCAVVWTFFGTGMKIDLFQSCGHCWVSKFAGIFLFLYVYLSLGLSYVNWARWECCLFYLRSSLWSSNLLLFYFCGLFPSLSFSHCHFGLLFPILPT